MTRRRGTARTRRTRSRPPRGRRGGGERAEVARTRYARGTEVGRRRGAAAPRPGRGRRRGAETSRARRRREDHARRAAPRAFRWAGPARARARARCEGAPPPPPGGAAAWRAARAPGETCQARGRRVRRVVAQQQLSDVYSAYVDVMRGYRGPDSRGPERRARAPRARLTQQYSAIRLFARIWHRNRVIARVLRRRLRIHRGATRLRSRVSPATPRSVTAPLARAFPRASVLETLASLATSAGGDF